MTDQTGRGISRRQCLTRIGAAALLTPALGGLVAEADGQEHRSTPATPDEALRALVEGNARFAQGKVSNPNRTLARLQELGTRQVPFAAVLACSDSRVPVEILFDQGFGKIFVARRREHREF